MVFDETLAMTVFPEVTGDAINFGAEALYLLCCCYRIISLLRKVGDRDARATFSGEHDSGGSSYATISTGDERRFTLEPSTLVSPLHDRIAVTYFPLP